MSTPLPVKPKSFACVLVSQKPVVDKLVMKLAKQVALYGVTKTEQCSAGILDYIVEQFEKSEKVCSVIHEGPVQFDDEKRSNQEQRHK
eukprot:12702276-Ditylum_brightwellii.AAC.1